MSKISKTKAFKVFIDGEVGTVGLNIRERLENRSVLEILQIEPELRKDISERKKLLNTADFVFLCLPDDAAREAVSLIENPDTRVIDASTAHRTNDDWTYGFPELSPEQSEKIRFSKRVAVPGCYATGFIALIYPLISKGLIGREALISCFGISGYSGAGKSAIAEYESANRPSGLAGARMYALSQSHKHQPEMQKICGLENKPMFNPIIDDFYSGMLVSVPFMKPPFTIDEVRNVYKNHYNGTRIEVKDGDGVPFLAANGLSGSDNMEVYVHGNNEQILLTARFDNLGKGASGAAVQCFDLVQERVR